MPPLPQKPVRTCLCYPHSFAELKTLAEQNDWQTVADVTAAVGCGSGCGLCRPYLARMLETGETAFAILRREPDRDPQQSGETTTEAA
jgi:bacterioferritin-associated ferredoxin